MASSESPEPARAEVWAVTNRGDQPTVRTGKIALARAVERAVWIARQSGDEGAVSVWVVADGEIVWAAGEKATELTAQGVEVLPGGEVVADA